MATIGVATSLLAAAPAANADVSAMTSSGCNGNICVKAEGSGSYVSRTIGSVHNFAPVLSFYGFFRVFGPDYSRDSETKNWGQSTIFIVQVGRHYANGQQHCAEGWRRNNDGSFSLIGRPCVSNPI